ncbi:hypothetical protein MtrunA17_Chr6g0482331 [Medicago truncatula]|uniref:Uncharacterized protein n=1 Tax=Medicago truncatula TaxID=3880 RepID=A0A396HJ46_MEDTR|nr:hypothetical protein MtrunA17_Chr6g0482331 [Medicago truncatula]
MREEEGKKLGYRNGVSRTAMPPQARVVPLLLVGGFRIRHGQCQCFWLIGPIFFSFFSSTLDNYLQNKLK